MAYGILYYLETSEISRVPAIRHELRHMIMQRNELASYVRERRSLPPMLKQSHTCSRCYAKKSCFLYHKLVERGNGETSGMRNKFDEIAGHLTPSHQDFFKRWDALLTKEESEMMKFRRELWTMVSTERERLGRCFANVCLVPGSASEAQSTSKINRFQYTFNKLENATFSFNESQITVGEPIVVSDENGHYALAKGFVKALHKREVEVAVDRRLHNARIKDPAFDEKTNQSFSAIMEVGARNPMVPARASQKSADAMLYRIDKDEFSNGMATVRNNLIELMSHDAFHSREIRSQVVDGAEPRFKPTASAYPISGPPSQKDINEDQKAAIEKIMAAQDYALVLGMPGTGKTTTIAHIIRALVATGKSVLLTSYTHTAVDNILLKIRKDNIGILRLGATAKVHPEVREFATLGAEPKASIEELRSAYHDPQVVATTCLGINHQVFNERLFDYCIVDEASQITLPVCLGPIRMAKTFVLVGDHYQLPPLVQNREALEGGLDVSLFRLLCEQHPEAVVTLHHQYRMNAPIMNVANTIIYNGQLVCGSEAISRRFLELPDFNSLAQLHDSHRPPTDAVERCQSLTSSSCWLNRTLNPTSSPPVIFLDTDSLLPTSLETFKGARITNALEATLTLETVHGLLLAGASPSQIGIITPYRSQLALIKSMLCGPSSSVTDSAATNIHQSAGVQIEAHTTDRFQGRDKDIIILSLVRSNDRGIVGELLQDWRRVNVAVTRARKKLIIVGSKGTMVKGDEVLKKMVGVCESLVGGVVDVGEKVHSWGGDEISTSVRSKEDASAPMIRGNPAKGGLAPLHARIPLSSRSANEVPREKEATKQKSFKVPAKVGRVSERNIVKKGSVLQDIVNDALGSAGDCF